MDENLNVSFIDVKSSQIKKIGHKEQTLYVQFKKGNIYTYSPVSAMQFEEFKKAESKGSYFHKNLKSNKELFIDRIK